MKGKVIRPFKDKDNGKLYDTNSVYEGNEARCAELAKKGFLKIETAVPKKEEPEKKKKENEQWQIKRLKKQKWK